MTVGIQRHDERDGGPSFGIVVWPLVLNIIYPICFSIFVYCLSYLRSRVIQISILLAWVIVTVVYGYLFGNSYASFAQDPKNAGMYYGSVYFPSETKVVTPLLVGVVLFWTLWIMIKLKVEKTSSRQQ
jgi:hypothetical protein